MSLTSKRYFSPLLCVILESLGPLQEEMDKFLRIFRGCEASQILRAVAKYGYADLLHGGPKSSAELAVLAQTKEEPTKRVLRAAASIGIFDRDPETLKYSLNDVSRLLLDGPASMKWASLLHCSPTYVKAFLGLEKTLKDGSFAFGEVHGKPFFDYLASNPEESERFNKSTTAYGQILPVTKSFQANYDLTAVKTLVDVGGGLGSFLYDLLRLNPHMNGVLFEVPHVLEEAKQTNCDDVKSRVTFTPGNFFHDSVPSGGDVYTMKLVIHDWNDEVAIRILTNVRNALPSNGKVVVIEQLLTETGEHHTPMVDIMMLLMVEGSKERTEEEYRHLFSEAGLKLTRVVPLPPSSMCAFEGERMQ